MDADKRPFWEGHRNRLRGRLEREGWSALKPYEMVELVLCHAMPRQDLSEVSRLLVDRFGSVGGVFAASRSQLMAVPGVTHSMAEWIARTGELIQAYRQTHGFDVINLNCYRQVLGFLAPRLRLKPKEGLWVLYADFSFNLISLSDLQESPVWWAAENARRLMMDAIGYGARYLYFILWKPEPSAGLDEGETARLESIASLICAADLDLVDCLLVNSDEVFSMRVHGRMDVLRSTLDSDRLREQYGEQG